MSYVYDHGSGTAGDPYQVWTANDLDGVRDHTDAYFIQMAEIDLYGWDWVPIGHDANWSGSYDGNNFKISNLTTRVGPDESIPIVVTEWDNVGLFGRWYVSEVRWIKNVNIENAYIDNTRTKGAGILIGRHSGYTRIKNCKVEGTFVTTGSVATPWRTGGLIGSKYTAEGYIADCFANINFTGRNISVGGLIGREEDDVGSEIKRCYSIGSISETSESYATVGGLVGWLDNYNTSISNCYSRCDIESISEYTGGLVGWAEHPVANCYSTGYINSVASAGGLIGHTESTVTNSYYDTETSGKSDDDGRGTPKTTAEMIYPYSDPDNVYIDWDFHTVWAHDKGGSA